MSGDTFYITTPIYYVNGTPHIGHAYTSIAADVAARWQRLLGRDVRFLTGTDEHGQKVLEAAEARGMGPKEHCDDLVVVWKAMMDRLGISYDRFLRTTDADHEALVVQALQDLWDKGEIYADSYAGWYLVKDEVFVTEKEKLERIESGELNDDHFQWVSERNYFFRMGKYRQQLLDHMEAHPDCVLPENRRNEVLGFLRQPLGDLCISRPKERMSWGIELPFDPDFVCYVWFDALLNYVSGAAGRWPADYHLIGKDILTTHAVYWTTMLLAMGKPLPKHLYAHGWWVSSDGAKMSKSVGNVIDVDRLVDAFGVDATRYFFLREIRFGADGGFSYEGFLTRYNADLANDLGNLVHRSLSMTTRWLGETVPARSEPDPHLRTVASEAVAEFSRSMGLLGFKEALDALWDVVRAGNKFIDEREPWALNKAGHEDDLRSVMRDVLEACAVAGLLLLPVMPERAASLVSRLGITDPQAALARLLDGNALDVLNEGATLTVGDPLFPRHREMPAEIAAMFASDEPAAEVEVPLPDLEWIEFPDFAKLLLKVGHVLTAEPHPNADKLVVMKVDVGEARPRTICAGIREVFAPEALVGRKVVVVANLKPRKLRGIPSEGMILAAGGETVVDLVTVAAEPGDTVR